MMDRTWRSASRSTAPSTRTRARPISTSTTPGGTQGALTDSAVGEGLTSWLQQTGTKAGVGCSTSVRTACRRQSLQQATIQIMAPSHLGNLRPWRQAFHQDLSSLICRPPTSPNRPGDHLNPTIRLILMPALIATLMPDTFHWTARLIVPAAVSPITGVGVRWPTRIGYAGTAPG
jgi:hypothetical protein